MRHGSPELQRARAGTRLAFLAALGLALALPATGATSVAPDEPCPSFRNQLADILDDLESPPKPELPRPRVGPLKGTDVPGLFLRADGDTDLITELRAIPLDPADFRVLLSVKNQATLKAAKKKFPKKLHQLGEGGADDVAQDMQGLFERNAGKFLVVIGHAERGNLVMRSSGGDLLAQYPLPDFEALARHHDVRLLVITCDAADDVASGATGPINTLAAVRRVADAHDSANLYDFLAAVASDDLRLVVDRGIAAQGAGGRTNITVHGHFELDGEAAAVGVMIVAGSGGSLAVAAHDVDADDEDPPAPFKSIADAASPPAASSESSADPHLDEGERTAPASATINSGCGCTTPATLPTASIAGLMLLTARRRRRPAAYT